MSMVKSYFEVASLIEDLKNRKVVIFGAGRTGKIIASYIIENEPRVDLRGFFDNSCFQWGKRIIGDSYCFKPTKIANDSIGLVCVGESSQDIVKEQCIKLGFDMVFLWKGILKNEMINEDYLQKYLDIKNKRTPKKKLYYVVDIAEHCKLNCQMCDHFAPLSPEYYMKLESYIKDTERIKALYGNDVTLICLEGGEPLLHPDISRFIEETRRILSGVQIQLFTSGLVLHDMDDKFWEVCKECGVTIVVTKYPVKYDYGAIEQLALSKDVCLEYFCGNTTVKTSYHKPIDLLGKQDIYESFHNCYMANGECVDIKDGRLYPCTFAANLHIFNNHFSKSLKISERDFIDIHSDVTKDDIAQFLSNPIPACRYCKVKEWTYNHPWKISNRSIEEWT